jgi:hypothetical protein
MKRPVRCLIHSLRPQLVSSRAGSGHLAHRAAVLATYSCVGEAGFSTPPRLFGWLALGCYFACCADSQPRGKVLRVLQGATLGARQVVSTEMRRRSSSGTSKWLEPLGCYGRGCQTCRSWLLRDRGPLRLMDCWAARGFCCRALWTPLSSTHGSYRRHWRNLAWTSHVLCVSPGWRLARRRSFRLFPCCELCRPNQSPGSRAARAARRGATLRHCLIFV